MTVTIPPARPAALPIRIIDMSSSGSDPIDAAAVQIASFDPFKEYQSIIEPEDTRPPMEVRVQRLGSRIRRKLRPGPDGQSSHVGYKAVREDTGEVVGVAYWMKPGRRHKIVDRSKMDDEEREAWEGWNVEKYSSLYRAFQKQMDEVLEQRGESGCWYLEILAIHPQYQSQRIGSRLLDHHLALVDSPDQTVVTAPAYLESSPEGNRLYKSRGYVEIGEVVAEGWDGGFPGMLRSRRGVQDSS